MDDIRKMSVPERLDLLEAIWESIAEEAGGVPVSETQIAEATRRLEEHDADPSTGIPWEEAEARLRV